MQSAIVLDGGLKSALAIVRSLGKRGIRVCAGADRKTGMSLYSKFAVDRFVYPSPYTDEAGFIATVLREAKRLGDKPVVFACSDATVLALYRAQRELSEYMTLRFPETRAMEIAFDKAITYSLARVSGIPTIPTFMPTTPEELRRTADTVRYPAVLKPRKSVTRYNGVRHFGTARFMHSSEELIREYTRDSEIRGESPLIQERMTGEEYGVETVARRGEPFVLVTHHRLRSLSPIGGAAVLKETVEKGALRDMLETYARKIIHELHWEGPIMVEFKVDSDTRTPKLMEVNGRFWGSLPLSVASGVDMPYHYYCLATGDAFPKEESTERSGVVTRHFFGDVRNLLTVLFARDKMRPHAYPGRIEAVKSFLRVPRGTKGDVWSLSDPEPALYEIIDIVKRLWK
jgi:predicted ATP-grasp superfamily ATP-dependent carboligase